MNSNYVLFQPSQSWIHTDDPRLTLLLKRIHDKICEMIHKPWSTLQKTIPPTYGNGRERGWLTPQHVSASLLHYHVLLTPNDLQLVWSTFVNSDGHFDWARFVSAMFRTEKGEQVIPRARTYRNGDHMHMHMADELLSSTTAMAEADPIPPPTPPPQLSIRVDHPSSRHPPELGIYYKHPTSMPSHSSFFGGRNARPEYAHHGDPSQAQLASEDELTQAYHTLVYPVSSGPPPAKLLESTLRRQHQVENERNRLEQAFRTTRKTKSATTTMGAQHSNMVTNKVRIDYLNPSNQRPRNGLTSSFASSTSLPPRLAAAAAVSAPLQPIASVRLPRRETTRPTYMLPVEHRLTAEEKAIQSRNQALFAHSMDGKYRPSTERIHHVNNGVGERVHQSAISLHSYKIPSIQFGQALKF